MVLNPFFQQGSRSEQGLLQDLVNEQLRMYGVDVHYLPRQYAKKNTIIREVITSEFGNAYPLEAYIENFEGYGDTTTILSKFGIQAENEVTLIISKERYENYITPLIENIPNIDLATRPKEGDLIYFPLGDSLFEIKFVEHEKPFYQLRKNYVYELRCELFRYEDEVIDTGIEAIDDTVLEEGGVGYTQTLTVVGAGVTATAVTTLVNNGIRLVTLSDRGSGYVSAPKVGFSSVASGGVTAVGIATLITNIVDCSGLTSGKIQGVELTNPGYGYTETPAVSFTHSAGVGAAGTVGLSIHRNVGVVTITESGSKPGGSGYVVDPPVPFTAPKHVGAQATASIASTSLSAITVSTGASAYLFPGGTTGGVYYASAPAVTISDPDTTGTTAIGVATIRYNSITTNGDMGIGSSVVTGVTTAGIIVGDRVRLETDWNDPTYNIIPADTWVYSIGVGSITMSANSTGVTTSTKSLEFGIDQCGIVTGITITNAGTGYTQAPTVSISNTEGDKNYVAQVVGVATAQGRAHINSVGVVTMITLKDSGCKYIQEAGVPTITIGDPYMFGEGNFIFNEKITGSATTTTARVKTWNSDTNVLEVSIVAGTFQLGEVLTGAESGAKYKLRTINVDDTQDKFADNINIEAAADDIIDFSSTNPFGMP